MGLLNPCYACEAREIDFAGTGHHLLCCECRNAETLARHGYRSSGPFGETYRKTGEPGTRVEYPGEGETFSHPFYGEVARVARITCLPMTLTR
jgi:hypothetical protein